MLNVSTVIIKSVWWLSSCGLCWNCSVGYTAAVTCGPDHVFWLPSNWFRPQATFIGAYIMFLQPVTGLCFTAHLKWRLNAECVAFAKRNKETRQSRAVTHHPSMLISSWTWWLGGGGEEALTSCLLSRQHNFSPPDKYLTCLPPVAVAVFLHGFHYFTKPFRPQ